VVKESLKDHDVVLFVNSGAFKRNEGPNLSATHFIHVESITKIGNDYIITYWDYGSTNHVTIDADQFFWSVYGIIEIPKTND